jgi:hypothetical protein
LRRTIVHIPPERQGPGLALESENSWSRVRFARLDRHASCSLPHEAHSPKLSVSSMPCLFEPVRYIAVVASRSDLLSRVAKRSRLYPLIKILRKLPPSSFRSPLPLRKTFDARPMELKVKMLWLFTEDILGRSAIAHPRSSCVVHVPWFKAVRGTLLQPRRPHERKTRRIQLSRGSY